MTIDDIITATTAQGLSSPSVAKLNAALAKAQAHLRCIPKDSKATVRSEKGSYSYDYTSLASVLDAIREPLTANGLVLIQQPYVSLEQKAVLLVTKLMCGDEFHVSLLPMPLGAVTPQAVGSAISYARRYAIMPLLMLAGAEEDDDGAAAEESARRAPAPPPPVQTAARSVGADAFDQLLAIGSVHGHTKPKVIAWLKVLGFARRQDISEAALPVLEHRLQSAKPLTRAEDLSREALVQEYRQENDLPADIAVSL